MAGRFLFRCARRSRLVQTLPSPATTASPVPTHNGRALLYTGDLLASEELTTRGAHQIRRTLFELPPPSCRTPNPWLPSSNCFGGSPNRCFSTGAGSGQERVAEVPGDGEGYFTLLGLPPGFDVDQGDLEHRFKELQKQLHPDKLVTASPEEKEEAEGMSAKVNVAVNVLRSPLKRSIHLLELSGVGLGEEVGTIDHPELLMEVMEARAEVEEADTADRLQALKQENQEKMDACIRMVSDGFRSNDLATAKTETIRLTYLVRIEEAIDGRFAELKL